MQAMTTTTLTMALKVSGQNPALPIVLAKVTSRLGCPQPSVVWQPTVGGWPAPGRWLAAAGSGGPHAPGGWWRPMQRAASGPGVQAAGGDRRSVSGDPGNWMDGSWLGLEKVRSTLCGDLPCPQSPKRPDAIRIIS